MKFPTTELQITTLCHKMLNGYFWHQPDFPHINRIKLIVSRAKFMAAQRTEQNTISALRIATKQKNRKLLELKSIMKQCLQKAQVDTAANPEKLKLIGWDIRRPASPTLPPNQPRNLKLTAGENGSILLQWDRPAGRQRIVNYIIERYIADGSSQNDYQILAISYSRRIKLANQPQTVRLEYRVKAAHNAGQSAASNTVHITL